MKRGGGECVGEASMRICEDTALRKDTGKYFSRRGRWVCFWRRLACLGFLVLIL